MSFTRRIGGFGAALGAAVLLSQAAQATPSYDPVGIQSSVPESTVLSGGWSICYSASYATPLGNDNSAALANCNGPDLMLAASTTDGSTFILLAQAPFADVTFNTGTGDFTTTHTANGTEWYYAANWSWGFAGSGETVDKFSCDLNSGSDRLCWHTSSLVGGYRIGDLTGLNNSVDFTKFILTDAPLASVPEPLTLSLFGAGLAGVVAIRRRRKSQIV